MAPPTMEIPSFEVMCEDFKDDVPLAPSTGLVNKYWDESDLEGFITIAPPPVSAISLLCQFFWSMYLGLVPTAERQFNQVNLVIDAIHMAAHPITGTPLAWHVPSKALPPGVSVPTNTDEPGKSASHGEFYYPPRKAGSEASNVEIMFQNWFKKLDQADAAKVTSFTALVIYRLVTKPTTSVESYLTHKLQSTMMSLFRFRSEVPKIPPPSTMLLEHLKACLERTTHPIQSTTAQILKAYKSGDEAVKNMLLAGCLTHMSSSGLTLSNLLQAACAVLDGVSAKQLLEALADRACILSCWKLAWFHRTYVSATTAHPLARWARVLDPAYFVEMRVKEHAKLASRFAGIIESDITAGPWGLYALHTKTAQFKMEGLLYAQKVAQYFAIMQEQGQGGTKVAGQVRSLGGRPPKKDDEEQA